MVEVVFFINLNDDLKICGKKYFNVKKIEKSIMFFFEANSNIKKKILFEDAGRKLMEHFFVCSMYYV